MEKYFKYTKITLNNPFQHNSIPQSDEFTPCFGINKTTAYHIPALLANSGKSPETFSKCT
jgi:hypothetical protein